MVFSPADTRFSPGRIKDYCIRKRYRWSDCHAKSACREMEYYEDLIRYTRKSLAVSDFCRILVCHMYLSQKSCQRQTLVGVFSM
jgi:hypothetical protein